MHVQRIALVVAAVSWLAGCAGAPEDATAEPGSQVRVSIAALELTGIVNATWTVTVRNESGSVVWTRDIDADSFGDGVGAVSYVGPCDAQDDPSDDGIALGSVELVLASLTATSGPLLEGIDYMNPAPASQPLVRQAECVANTDAAVRFDVTVARRANQGFFDVAVNFDQIFCSAKLDCRRDSDADGEITLADAALELLYNGATRDKTVVLGLACTGGNGQAGDTVLYRNPVTVTCVGGTATVDPALGPGNVAHTSTGTDPLFGAAVYVADIDGNFQQRYWNVALGLLGGTSCRVTTTATARAGYFPGLTTPSSAPWPVIEWDVPLTGVDGQLACTSHPLDGGNGVRTSYQTGVPFAAAVPVPAVGSEANPAQSCLDVLTDEPTATDGLYWVAPLGTPTQVWCDMQGGGWTLVYRGTNAAGTNQSPAVDTAGPMGTAPITATTTGNNKLDDALINAMRSGAVANDLRLTVFKGTPLVPVGTAWHKSACVLASATNHPVGDVCLDTTLSGPNATNYLGSNHSGGLTRWFVDDNLAYVWGYVSTHVGPMPGGTEQPIPPYTYCTWYDTRVCPVDTAIEVWIY